MRELILRQKSERKRHLWNFSFRVFLNVFSPEALYKAHILTTHIYLSKHACVPINVCTFHKVCVPYRFVNKIKALISNSNRDVY